MAVNKLYLSCVIRKLLFCVLSKLHGSLLVQSITYHHPSWAHTHTHTCSRCYIQWALLLKFHCQDNQTASYRILFVTYIQKWQVSSEIHQMWCSQTYTFTSFPKLVSAFFKNNTAILDLPIHLGSYHTAHFPSHSSNLLFRFLCHTFYKDAEATQCVTKNQSAGSGCNGDDCTTYWHVCIMLRTSI